MIVELIYTSAPETLDGPGYGVVAKSDGLPARLEAFLRQLNRYDFSLASEGSADDPNPTVYSHTKFVDGSTRWHVLSRVGHGGRDYSGRSVFLAHHVALTADELRDRSAVELLREPSLFVESWDGRAGSIADRVLPAVPARARTRGVWNRLAGSPDWAKFWVDRWSKTKGGVAFLVAPSGADVVGLFGEASAVLSSTDANEVTFITHLIADRTGVHFDWIGIPAGTDLARATLSQFPDRALDLTRPLGTAPRVVAPAVPPPVSAPPTRPPLPPGRAPKPTPMRSYDLQGEMEGDAQSRSGGRRRSTEPADSSFTATPPPPPPPPPPSRVNSALLVGSGFAMAMLFVGAAWFSGLFRLGPRTATAIPTKIVKPTLETDSDTPRGERQTARPVSKGEVKRKPDESPNPVLSNAHAVEVVRVVHLQEWLNALLKKGKANGDGWFKVVEIKDPIAPTLELLALKQFDLKSEPPKSVQSPQGPELEISGKAGPKNQLIRLRLHGRSLELNCDPEASADLLTALQFSALRIRSKDGDANGKPVEVTTIVVFTPLLPAIPLTHDKMWTETPELKDGAVEFFKKMGELAKDVKFPARLKVDRLSLAALPTENHGWRIAPREKHSLQTCDEALEITWAVGGKWPATLHIETHFDDNAKPTIMASLADRVADDKDQKSQKNDLKTSPKDDPPGPNKDLSTPPKIKSSLSTRQGGFDLAEGIGLESSEDSFVPMVLLAQDPLPSKIQGNRKSSKASKRKAGPVTPDTNATEKPQEKSPDPVEPATPPVVAAVSPAVPPTDDKAFLRELFRRHGQVHGAIYLSVPDSDGKAPVELEIIRFGTIPKNPPTSVN